ncbi:MAG: hypothetical protein H5T64_13175 [Chloroflexi bacterium]|nr:hypothetical protein [Chloroflexota bacterium]
MTLRGGALIAIATLVLSCTRAVPPEGQWQTIGGQRTQALAVSDDVVWMGTLDGLLVWERATGKMWHYAAESLPPNIRDVAIDRGGSVWMAAWGAGVMVREGERWRTYSSESHDLASNFVTALLPGDSRGGMWFCTWDSGVTSWARDGNRRTYTSRDGLASNSVTCVAEDVEGRLWFGTWGGGVSVYTPPPAGGGDGCWSTYNTGQGLAADYVMDIVADGSGHIWVATTAGVSVLDRGSWRTYSEHDGLGADWVWSLAAVGDVVFAGTWGGGVSVFREGGWKTYTVADGLSSNEVRALAADAQGHIWASGAGGGLSEYDGAAWHTVVGATALPYAPITSLAADPAGRIWVGTWGSGVSVNDGSQWRTHTIGDGVGSRWVNSIAIGPSGEVWVGTEGGLSVYRDGCWTTFPLPRIRALAIEDNGVVWAGGGSRIRRYDGVSWADYELPNGGDVWALALDPRGRLWVGTCDEGLFEFDPRRGTWVTEHTEGGLVLPCDEITALDVDETSDFRVWVGTRCGIAVLDSFDGWVWRVHTIDDGLSCNRVVALHAAGGRAWVATSGGGLSIWDGTAWRSYIPAGDPQQSVLTALTVDEKERVWVSTSTGVSVWAPR